MTIPVSLPDARRQLHLVETDTSRDTELQQYIADAASWVEEYTGHILVARDVEERFASFERLQLRAWPVKPNASVGVGYALAGPTATSLYGARIATDRRPATILPPLGTWWPACARDVVILVRAGYEDADPVPGAVRRAMLVLIAAYDADREGGELFATAEATARRICRTGGLVVRGL